MERWSPSCPVLEVELVVAPTTGFELGLGHGGWLAAAGWSIRGGFVCDLQTRSQLAQPVSNMMDQQEG